METMLSLEDSAVVLQVERRARPRIPCDPPRLISVLARPYLERIPAHVCNFSAIGIGITTDQPFEVDTLLTVQLPRREVGRSEILTAKVVHTKELPSGKWYMGCSLSRRLTPSEQHGLRYGQGLT
jgi:hypothetical protein